MVVFLIPSPRDWPNVLRRLRQDAGWAAPVFLLASLGLPSMLVMLGLMIGANLHPHAILGAVIVWALLGIAASVYAGWRSMRAMRRMGFWGWSRARWWFELGRILALTSVFLIAMLLAVLFVSCFPAAQAALNPLWAWRWLPMSACAATISAFFFAGTCGYGLSWLTGRARGGKAYECVQFFYLLGGGLLVMGISATFWPMAALWPDGAVLCGGIVVGGLMFGLGILTINDQYEKRHVK